MVTHVALRSKIRVLTDVEVDVTAVNFHGLTIFAEDIDLVIVDAKFDIKLRALILHCLV